MKDFELELLRKYLENKTSEFETEVVAQWLLENNLTRKDIIYMLENKEKIDVFERIDTAEDWPKVSEKIQSRRKTVRMRFFMRAAASIAIIIALAGISTYVYQYINQPIVVDNNSNHVMNVMLPDSSWVSLNQNSKLAYNGNFSQKRELTVEGQMFFEVKRNVHKPFVINTFDSRIRVLGTSFYVSTNPQKTNVIVTTGKVAFLSTKKQCDTLFLVKGDKGTYEENHDCLEKVKNEDYNYLSWKNHILTFSNTAIRQVFSDLEKYFDVKIKVSSSAIYNLSYTSEFKNPSLREVLKEMELVLNIKSNVEDRNITVSPK
jgi:ferric-dicitrate binding protein FerR (iron transport regulator)